MRRTAKHGFVLVLFAATLNVAVGLRQADAGGLPSFGGIATYTGKLGPVSRQHTICVCAYSDPGLTLLVGCLEVDTSPGSYQAFTQNMKTYYLVAFLDLNLNVDLDPGEPYRIYNNKATPPGDPVVASATPASFDITFGDEDIAPIPTASPTPTSTALAIPTATATPTALPCAGDCNRDSQVTVDEILTLVNVALGLAPASDCRAGDADSNDHITIDEILTAVSDALHGCAAASLQRD